MLVFYWHTDIIKYTRILNININENRDEKVQKQINQIKIKHKNTSKELDDLYKQL